MLLAKELIYYVNNSRAVVWKYKAKRGQVITDEEKRLVELMARHQEKLYSSLRTSELDSFNKYVECSVEYASLIDAQAFEIGFRLAMDLLTE